MSVQIYEMAVSSGITQSGYWATNTLNIRDGLLKHLFVDYGNTAVNFGVVLTDNKNRNVVNLSNISTNLNRSYDLPMRGIYTLAITNASVDTNFLVRLAVQDVF